MSEKEKHAADEREQECARRSQEEKRAADEHAHDLRCMAEEEKLAADKRLRHTAQERARKDRKAMEKCVHDDLEFEVYDNQMKLDQKRDRLHVDTLIIKAEDFQARCNDEIAFAD